jgi:hypothetical protein
MENGTIKFFKIPFNIIGEKDYPINFPNKPDKSSAGHCHLFLENAFKTKRLTARLVMLDIKPQLQPGILYSV